MRFAHFILKIMFSNTIYGNSIKKIILIMLQLFLLIKLYFSWVKFNNIFLKTNQTYLIREKIPIMNIQNENFYVNLKILFFGNFNAIFQFYITSKTMAFYLFK